MASQPHAEAEQSQAAAALETEPALFPSGPRSR